MQLTGHLVLSSVWLDSVFVRRRVGGFKTKNPLGRDGAERLPASISARRYVRRRPGQTSVPDALPLTLAASSPRSANKFAEPAVVHHPAHCAPMRRRSRSAAVYTRNRPERPCVAGFRQLPADRNPPASSGAPHGPRTRRKISGPPHPPGDVFGVRRRHGRPFRNEPAQVWLASKQRARMGAAHAFHYLDTDPGGVAVGRTIDAACAVATALRRSSRHRPVAGRAGRITSRPRDAAPMPGGSSQSTAPARRRIR